MVFAVFSFFSTQAFAQEITVTPEKLSLSVGEEAKLNVTVKDENGKIIS